MSDIISFLHLLGIVVAFGADAVIATHGILSRNSIHWTQATINTHHVTKPLIWAGAILATITWLFMMPHNPPFAVAKLILLFVVMGNGLFLSFYISPHLDELWRTKKLFPLHIQELTIAGMIISVSGWLTIIWMSA